MALGGRRITDTIRIIIATASPLPPTHHGRLGDRVRNLEFQGLEVTNVLRIVVVGGSICRILAGLEAQVAQALTHGETGWSA